MTRFIQSLWGSLSRLGLLCGIIAVASLPTSRAGAQSAADVPQIRSGGFTGGTLPSGIVRDRPTIGTGGVSRDVEGRPLQIRPPVQSPQPGALRDVPEAGNLLSELPGLIGKQETWQPQRLDAGTLLDPARPETAERPLPFDGIGKDLLDGLKYRKGQGDILTPPDLVRLLKSIDKRTIEQFRSPNPADVFPSYAGVPDLQLSPPKPDRPMDAFLVATRLARLDRIEAQIGRAVSRLTPERVCAELKTLFDIAVTVAPADCRSRTQAPAGTVWVALQREEVAGGFQYQITVAGRHSRLPLSGQAQRQVEIKLIYVVSISLALELQGRVIILSSRFAPDEDFVGSTHAWSALEVDKDNQLPGIETAIRDRLANVLKE